MLRSLSLLAVACSVNAMSPGVLSPRFMELASKVLPEDSENWHKPLSYELPKYTPGDACGVHAECDKCLLSQVCVWLPFNSKCVEDRNPSHKAGTMQCGTWTPDELPVIPNEHDDYRLFHTRGDPRDFNIATLKGGQDMYGRAVDMEATQAAEATHLATMGGGEVLDGLTHDAFEGQTLQHDMSGHMLSLGMKGVEAQKPCRCKEKFAGVPCNCAFPDVGS